mmetsp:Transcript_11454/g.26062  ORF Transcript_11454/g.26062 Transcript_11454/m.26062 type:complete len:222 (-) Transcript_11454:1058-1723(-)
MPEYPNPAQSTTPPAEYPNPSQKAPSARAARQFRIITSRRACRARQRWSQSARPRKLPVPQQAWPWQQPTGRLKTSGGGAAGAWAQKLEQAAWQERALRQERVQERAQRRERVQWWVQVQGQGQEPQLHQVRSCAGQSCRTPLQATFLEGEQRGQKQRVVERRAVENCRDPTSPRRCPVVAGETKGGEFPVGLLLLEGRHCRCHRRHHHHLGVSLQLLHTL